MTPKINKKCDDRAVAKYFLESFKSPIKHKVPRANNFQKKFNALDKRQLFSFK